MYVESRKVISFSEPHVQLNVTEEPQSEVSLARRKRDALGDL